jgi:hypothetical protein
LWGWLKMVEKVRGFGSGKLRYLGSEGYIAAGSTVGDLARWRNKGHSSGGKSTENWGQKESSREQERRPSKKAWIIRGRTTAEERFIKEQLIL